MSGDADLSEILSPKEAEFGILENSAWKVFEGLPSRETASMAVSAPQGCDSKKTMAVYILHFLCFHFPVVRRVLNDAKGINPEILVSKPSRNEDCVLKSKGNIFHVNAFLKCFVVGGCQLQNFRTPPNNESKLSIPVSCRCRAISREKEDVSHCSSPRR